MDDGAVQRRTVTTPDGRALDVTATGPPDGPVVVYHHGTPFPTVPGPLADAGAARGLRTLSWARPGYGGSDPQPGRTVADGAGDTAAVLDALGVGPCWTLGWSGGGPHALGAAAGLADRCRGVAVLAGVAPSDAPDLDWTAGMGPENVEEFALARTGGAPFRQAVGTWAAALADCSATTVVDVLGGLLAPADLAVLEGAAPEVAAALAAGVAAGTAGWHDDDRAFVAPWGVDPGALGVPVDVWYGTEDLMVPPAHGDWLADHLPGARRHRLAGEGHLSLVWLHAGAALDALVGRADL